MRRARIILSREYWADWFRMPKDELTLMVMGKGHAEVRKVRVSPRTIWYAKLGVTGLAVFIVLSFVLTVDYLVRWPERSMIRMENVALRKELNNLQYNLDSLQVAVDRMGRFDQKLRALTEVDKEFAKLKGPVGQGGGESEGAEEDVSFDFGDFRVDASQLEVDPASHEVLDRRQTFLVQKLYSWMGRLFQASALQEQSLEELFEVLKGREAEIAARPTIMPVGGWPTSHFGYRIDPFTGKNALHRGLDIAARMGAPIVAPADGVVTFSGSYGSYGNAVMLFHGYGVSTLYAHAKSLNVRVGEKIKRGDVIAYVGNSGRSTATHLHYEVIVHGVPVDPRKYVLDRSL